MPDDFGDHRDGGKDLPVKVSGAVVEVMGNPDFGWAKVTLEPGQSIFVEGGAMSTMKGDMEMKSRLMGGFLGARSCASSSAASPCSWASTRTRRGAG